MVEYLVTIIYLILLVLLFYKSKFFGSREYNGDYLSKDTMKALQGFASIAIIVHHVAQKTCAYGIPPEYVRHGLEPFLNIGFLLVALFFFCSGYGLTVSDMNNVNYMDDFIKKRVVPLIIPFALTNTVFLSLEATRGIDSNFGLLPNTYSWFVIVIFGVYILFWLVFRTYIKERFKFLLVTLEIIAFIGVLYVLGSGEWWYNSLPAFLLGMFYARFNTKITSFIRKCYPFALIVFSVLFAGMFYVSNYTDKDFWGVGLYTFPLVKSILQMVCSSLFVLLVFTILMKIRIGNPVLGFFGKYTLELYLFHVVFVEIFGWCFIYQSSKPYLYISSNTLYLFAVILAAIPVSIVINKLNRFVVKLVYKINIDIFEFTGHYYRKFVIALLVIVILVTGMTFYVNKDDVKAAREAYDNYIVENDIKLIDVGNGNTVAASVNGEGRTIVLLDFSDFTSPIFYYKRVAKIMTDNYRVVILETPGFGFAGEAKTEQNIETVVDEIHTALNSLGINEDYVMFARNEGSFVVDSYISLYSDEVSEIITLDGNLVNQYQEIISATNSYWDGFWYGSYRSLKIRSSAINSFKVTGYISWFWESFSRYLEFLYFDSKEIEAMHYIYVNQYYSDGFVDLYNDLPFYCERNMDFSYSEDTEVTMIVSGGMCDNLRRNFQIDWEELHNRVITNCDNQSAIYMYGTSDTPMAKQTDFCNLLVDILES